MSPLHCIRRKHLNFTRHLWSHLHLLIYIICAYIHIHTHTYTHIQLVLFLWRILTNIVTNYPKTYLIMCQSPESRQGLAESSTSGTLSGLQSQCWLGLQSPLNVWPGKEALLSPLSSCCQDPVLHRLLDWEPQSSLEAGGHPQLLAMCGSPESSS